MRLLLSLSFLTLLSAITYADKPFAKAPAETGEYKTLFNGKNLDGWDGDPRLWSTKDGAIRGETTAEKAAKGNTFLIWQKGKVADFELRISFRCNAINNSGIQYRSEHVTEGKVRNKWVVRGYQHEIRNEEVFPNVPSFIYDEKGKRGRLSVVGQKIIYTKGGKKKVERDDLIDQAGFKELMKVDDWNDVVIVAKGNQIQHYLNGRLVMDFTDQHANALSSGILALQLHAGKPMWTEFKNIRLKELK